MPDKQPLAAWWKRIAPQLRRAAGLDAPTLKEADDLMAGVEEVPISEEEIDRIVASVCGKSDA